MTSQMKRRKLPNDRSGKTRKAKIGGRNLYLTTGEYEDGTLGEIFIKCGKNGKSGSIYDIVAICMSLGLQYEIPLKVFTDKMKYQKMSDGGVTSDPEIPICDSVIDYIGKRLELDYGQNERTTDDNDQGMETIKKA